jgi:hypothetical protein
MMFRSPAYLKFVRSHPCVFCAAPAERAHHFDKRHGGGGTAVKPHDTFTVPLCAVHHDAVHGGASLSGLDALETECVFTRVALQLVSKFWESFGRPTA